MEKQEFGKILLPFPQRVQINFRFTDSDYVHCIWFLPCEVQNNRQILLQKSRENDRFNCVQRYPLARLSYTVSEAVWS